MTSRERVQRCLTFSCPDRPPRDLWTRPYVEKTHGEETIKAFRQRWPADIGQVPGCRPKPKLTQGDPYLPGESRDEWGCVFVNIQQGVHGEVKHPLLEDWERLKDLRPPEELLQVDVDGVNAYCRSTDLYVHGGGWARPFERMQFLRGSENLYLDIAEDSDEFHALLDLVHDFYARQYKVWARTNVDALVMMDDWGGQKTLLISPDRWRRLFKPLYAEYVAIAHESGKKFFMHSDGFIFPIYEDLIEIGVDAINSQLFCMDIEEIGKRFAGRITFWGEIDRQHILPFGTPEEVRAAVQRVCRNLYRPEGGVFAQFEFASNDPLANAEAVYRAWDEWNAAHGPTAAGASARK